MNQTCDRCGPAVRAAYRAARDGELYLCRHCTTRLRAALSAQGWSIWPIASMCSFRKPASSWVPGHAERLDWSAYLEPG